MNTSKLLLLFLLLVTRSSAQVILDNFNGAPGEGAVLAGSSWVGNATLSGGTLTVRAHDDNGWGIFNLSPALDLHLMNMLTVTGSADSGNAASFFNVYFEDQLGNPQVFNIDMSNFSAVSGSVSVPITWSIDASNIAAWTIGGGGFTTTGPAFNMTLDQISLSTAAVPEPTEWATVAGVGVLALAAWRRWRLRASCRTDSAA